MEPLCYDCGKAPRRESGKSCLECHARYMRDWRKSHPLTPLQRLKDNARSYANVYLRRGKLVRQPCECCGNSKAQMHHPDYSEPLKIQWLCRPCHLDLHAAMPSIQGRPLVVLESILLRETSSASSGP